MYIHLASKITRKSNISTRGIGGPPLCLGVVLVWIDIYPWGLPPLQNVLILEDASRISSSDVNVRDMAYINLPVRHALAIMILPIMVMLLFFY